jgi:general secretion pathway protein C
MNRRTLTALVLASLGVSAPAQEVLPEAASPEAVGVVVAAAPGRSVAVLRAGTRTRVAAVGETVFGARVVSVEPGAIVLDVGGREVVLRLGAAPAAPAGAEAPVATAAPPAGAPGTREMLREELQRRIATEAPRILAETTLVPVWNQGRVAGFTISRVPENSVLSDAGVEPGDVLTHVNGTPIESLATLVGLWPRLQSESVVEADLVRDGQPLHLSITLK